MTLPLENITILDLSRMLPGPYCTMILSDLGAEVIRVENPKDPMSNLPPFFQKGNNVILSFAILSGFLFVSNIILIKYYKSFISPD